MGSLISPEVQALSRIEAAKRELSQAKDLSQIKKVRDQAQAIKSYIKAQRGSLELMNDASELKLIAERRAGELLEARGEMRGKPSKLSQRETISHLGIDRNESSRWQAEATIPEKQFQGYIKECRQENEEITQAGLLRKVRAERTAEARETAGKLVIPKGKFHAIVIDPPWPIEKILREERPKQIELDYPVMTIEEIKALPIQKLIPENGAHVYLWVTHKFLPAGLELLREWGISYQCVMTWVKNVGMTPFSWMYSTEHILFGTAGGLKLEKLGMRLDFNAKVREHSRKPDEFYDLVERATPKPWLDLFARESRKGWEVAGNEVGKFDA